MFLTVGICLFVFVLKLEFHGTAPTPTRTLGMRLSYNFVNGYTIAYRVQYTFTRVQARIPNGHPREEKRACRSSRRTSGEDVGVDVGPMEFKINSTGITRPVVSVFCTNFMK